VTRAEFERLLTDLDARLAEFEHHPEPSVRERVVALIERVDAVHRAGLERLVDLMRERDPALVDHVARDPIAGLMLALYDLAPAADPAVGGRGFVPLAQLEASARAARARGRHGA